MAKIHPGNQYTIGIEITRKVHSGSLWIKLIEEKLPLIWQTYSMLTVDKIKHSNIC